MVLQVPEFWEHFWVVAEVESVKFCERRLRHWLVHKWVAASRCLAFRSESRSAQLHRTWIKARQTRASTRIRIRAHKSAVDKVKAGSCLSPCSYMTRTVVTSPHTRLLPHRRPLAIFDLQLSKIRTFFTDATRAALPPTAALSLVVAGN